MILIEPWVNALHDDSLRLDQGLGSLIGNNLLKSIGVGCIISPNPSCHYIPQ
jgi:hypothetical protein